jgi:hypothetical protein
MQHDPVDHGVDTTPTTPTTPTPSALERPAPWAPHVPVTPPGQGMGRSLWIAWCILWAAGWFVLGLVTLFIPLWVLTVLSLFAIAIGRPREVIVYRGR